MFTLQPNKCKKKRKSGMLLTTFSSSKALFKLSSKYHVMKSGKENFSIHRNDQKTTNSEKICIALDFLLSKAIIPTSIVSDFKDT